MKSFEFKRAKSVEEAHRLVTEKAIKSVIHAGGTD
jgi:CO/xanthine dehydrogenase FAD-binding subunit